MKRPELDGELETIQIELDLKQTTWINRSLLSSLKEELLAFLRKNANLFA